jgi:hypothetical protein
VLGKDVCNTNKLLVLSSEDRVEELRTALEVRARAGAGAGAGARAGAGAGAGARARARARAAVQG